MGLAMGRFSGYLVGCRPSAVTIFDNAGIAVNDGDGICVPYDDHTTVTNRDSSTPPMIAKPHVGTVCQGYG